MNTSHEKHPAPQTYSGKKVRQGEIILRRPWQRALFIAGLVGGPILALVLAIALG